VPEDSPDHRAFAALVDAHGPALLALLRRLSRDEHNAEDLFQETAARVWRNIRSRPVLRNPRAWLMKIGYHVFLDHRQPVKVPQELDADARPDLRFPSPPEQAEREESATRVRDQVADLSEPLRDVLALHYTAGLSIRDAAAAMGISTGTAKSRLNAALNELRRRLQ
jgi:RNA polymerase sigma-70 factor (ECF subfamily)